MSINTVDIPKADPPLRIALFSDSALPILNGVSISLDALIRGLRQRGHSASLFTARAPGFADPDPHTYRFFALETPWTKDYPLALPPFYPMLRHFRAQKFDLIHTHTPFTLGFVGLRWAQSHGLPLVSTYHTLYDKYAHYIPYFPKRYVRYKIAKHTYFYYNQVDQVIVPSEAARKWIRRHSVRKPVTVIPTGIVRYPSGSPQDLRRSMGASESSPVLLYVGRMAREKNLSTLLRGAAQVMQRIPGAVLWLVGDGPSRDEVVQMARDLGIGDRTRLVGFVPRAEVDRYYAAADLFLFASTTETQGLVVVEAMQYGLPAVVVQGGGAGAAVEDGVNGFLVRNDPEALAEAAGRCLEHPSLYAQLSAGAQATAERFSVDAMVDQVIQVYREALSPGSTPDLAREVATQR
ncbi:MAG TPA: glycosyltransferase [Fimbriimonadaceae bacterium]|nr:glycosyltransferase [Fimbriimonadaceae bacterium]HRJ32957.1 glycosyltransferase [Fimbriimonadaceae bacterium]